MSWLFSQALVEEFSEGICSDGEQSAPLSVMLTPQQFWRNDKMMDCSKPSLFGLTLQHLTEQDGEELLTLFRVGFRAKTLAAQDEVQESQESAADFGRNLRGLLAKYDHASCLWKTAQCSLFADLEQSLETFPRWGSMRSGGLFQRQIAVPPIKGKESGLWLTPRASDTGKGERQETFLARMGNRSDRCSQSLAAQVNNPKTWPTPTAHNSKETNAPSEANRNTPTLAAQAGGALNPDWVEWLMGWPIGWTDLKPLAMDKCQSWQQQHSES